MKLGKIICSLELGTQDTNLHQHFPLLEGTLFKRGVGNERECKFILPEELI